MKASEALRKCGDVARRESTGTIATMNRYESVVVTEVVGGPNHYWTKEYLGSVPGDDWTPLAPQVPLSELKRYTPFIAQTCSRTGECSIQWEQCDDGAAVFYDEVSAVSPVSDERVRELEERSAEWESAVEFLAEHGEHVVEGETSINQHIENLVEKHAAELSTLRAQLEGQWELGEPLTEGQCCDLPGDAQVVLVSNVGAGMECNLWGQCDNYYALVAGGWEVYLDPRPLPTLPSEPEPEVPAVPKFKGCIKYKGEVKFVQWLDESLNIANAVSSSGELHSYALSNCELFLGPVLHPDGTVAPIEPTQELLEALEKE